MKTFYVSLLIFFALLGLITWNMLFVNRSMCELETAMIDLPSCEEASADFEKVRAKWQALYRPLSFSVSFEDLRSMDSYFFQMQTAIDQEDALQYETARSGVLSTIKVIRRPEQFSLTSIL